MSGRVWLGLFLIVFGIGFFMQQADLLDFTQVLSTWWPLALIIIGIIQLVNRTYSSAVSGLLFLLVGALFLANQWVDFNVVAYLWPVILIVIGFTFIFARSKREGSQHTEQNINTFALFSGADVKSHSRDFAGGSVTTIFGGAEIDLRQADISEEAKMDLTAVFGGVSITVPENVQVQISGLPIFGGWEDKTVRQRGEDDFSVLKLNCLAICGGVEIKN